MHDVKIVKTTFCIILYLYFVETDIQKYKYLNCCRIQ